MGRDPLPVTSIIERAEGGIEVLSQEATFTDEVVMGELGDRWRVLKAVFDQPIELRKDDRLDLSIVFPMHYKDE